MDKSIRHLMWNIRYLLVKFIFLRYSAHVDVKGFPPSPFFSKRDFFFLITVRINVKFMKTYLKQIIFQRETFFVELQ